MRPSDSELIDNLARSLEPTSTLRRPKTLLALWIVTSIIYLGIIIWQSTAHHSLVFGPHSWSQLVAWFLVAAAFVCSSAGSIAAGIPGRRSVKAWLVASWSLVSAWAVWLVVRHYIEPATFDFVFRGVHRGDIKCACETFYWGLAPLALLYGIMRGLATVQAKRAGSLWLLSAFSLSAFLIQIMCEDESVFHQLYGHWLMLAVFGFAGFKAGRKLLHW
jgi:hypothetical protein